MSKPIRIYFASDFHLGAYPLEDSIAREKRIVAWLTTIEADCTELFLMGDLFDFWFEFKTVIPKGYVRFLGKIAEFVDKGIPVTLFKGNHDMWMFGYLENEIGVKVVSDDLQIERHSKTFFLHHGDGLGPGDYSYKRLKKIFRSPISQWLFARLHPNFSFRLAQGWSKKSRLSNGPTESFLGIKKEWLYQYASELSESQPKDFYIFGHRHLPMNLALPNGGRYINLGEWMHYDSYAVFDGEELLLKQASNALFPLPMIENEL
jgi:UDP-2,3-diacylglucosamine hydrolase